ncbi:MAG TPA: hypothetical protein DCX21_05490 [Eubacterium sp.]|nr:hypothetical protein [Eubacterium sp.]HBZ53285.1 hypothetical protein [Eubacterium sp.]
MKYILSRVYVLLGLLVVYAYIIYAVFEKELKRGRCNALFLVYETLPAFYYFAAFALVAVYLTAVFRLYNCKELCFDVYGRKNLGYIGFLLIINAIFSLGFMIVFGGYVYHKIGFDATFFRFIADRIMISYFLPACFAVIGGFAIAYYFSIKNACIISCIFIYLTSPSFDAWSTIKPDLLEYVLIIKNFDFIQNWDAGGDTVYLYKWLKIIGLICLTLVPVVKLITKKSKAIIAVLITFFIAGEVFYYMPQDRSVEDYWTLRSEAYYFKKRDDLAKISFDNESPFKIDSYDMDIKFTHMMSVKCDIKISPEDANKEAYDFTLYHSFRVSKVLYNGKKISYKRDGDYISVGKLGEGVLSIYYYGTHDDCSANSRNIALSEYCPYYPTAGKKMVHRSEGVNNDYDSLYRVKVNVKDIYTNLDQKSTYVYEAVCNGPYIMKGYFEEVEVDGYKVVYGKYNNFYWIKKEDIGDVIHEITTVYPDVKPKFIALNCGTTRGYKRGRIYVGNGYIEASERFKAEDVLDAEDNWDE